MMLADVKKELTRDDAIEADVADYDTNEIPREAAMVMSALEAGRSTHQERRMSRRTAYRTATRLYLFRDGPNPPGRVIYTRDIGRRDVGFVTPDRLPLGYGGIIHLPDDRGGSIEVHCTLLRCREAAPGWFEGCAYFNRDQPQFDR